MIELEKLGKCSILIVEDDGFNQELAAAIFEEYKEITILKADDGKEAFAVLEKEDVDIILLDLVMPNMNGFETLEALKKSDLYGDIPVIIVTSEENERKTTYKLGANDFISKPYNPTEVKLRVLNNLRIKKFSSVFDEIKHDSNEEGIHSSDYISNLKKALELADSSQKKLLSKLGNLAHDNENKEKASQRLGEYTVLMGNLYGLNKREIDDIFYAMSIYDIGLLRLPKETYPNTEGHLFKTHPQLGIEILNDLEETHLIKMAKTITLYHHENWDGSGYPKGLKAEAIPLYTRIASIADYFDELTSIRSYDKDFMSCEDALEVMKRESAIKLDPTLLRLFIDNFEKFVNIKNKFAESSFLFETS
jgi:putative two-component system response regulator